ncbi:Wee1-like protein kinase, partial [Tanacetum coccineum]
SGDFVSPDDRSMAVNMRIGTRSFGNVFKALNRFDGCMYAIKISERELNVDAERVKFSGYHDNIVGYTTCWFEDNKLYMQMELCDRILSFNVSSRPFAEGDLLEAMHQDLAAGDLLEAMHQVLPAGTAGDNRGCVGFGLLNAEGAFGFVTRSDITTDNNRKYLAPTLTKRLFANMKRGYAGEHVPLLPTMLAGVAEDQGEGSTIPADPHPIPSAPDTEIPQSQGPTITHVADEATTTRVGVDTEGATTTPFGLDAGLDSGNIHESLLRSNEAPLHEEKELHHTKNTYGKAVLTLVERVKSLEVALKRKTKKVVVSDSEDEETKNQGRKIQDIDDDPLVSLVKEYERSRFCYFYKVASQTFSTYKRRARSTDKGKDISTGLDAEAEVNTGSENFNSDSIGVNTGSAPVSTPSVV